MKVDTWWHYVLNSVVDSVFKKKRKKFSSFFYIDPCCGYYYFLLRRNGKNKTKLESQVSNSKSIIQKGMMQLRRAKNPRLYSIRRRSTMLSNPIYTFDALTEGMMKINSPISMLQLDNLTNQRSKRMMRLDIRHD